MSKSTVTRLPVIPTLPPEFIPLVAAAIPPATPGALPFNGTPVHAVRRGLAKLAEDFGADSDPYRRALLVASLRLAQAKAAKAVTS